jgi:hypothetical protein
VLEGGLESEATQRKVLCEQLIEMALKQEEDKKIKKRQERAENRVKRREAKSLPTEAEAGEGEGEGERKPVETSEDVMEARTSPSSGSRRTSHSHSQSHEPRRRVKSPSRSR